MPVIVTSTFYKDPEDVRFKLACRFLDEAEKAGYPVVLVDDSPTKAAFVREAFTRNGVTLLQQDGGGMGAGRRQALREALASFPAEKAFAWVEPEKAPLVSLLGPAMDKAANGFSFVLPRRRTLRSYPEYQQFCEYRGNWEAGNMTGAPELDLWFGPRVMSRTGANLFLSYDGEYGDRWDSIFVPVIRALDSGLTVYSEVVDYVHPPEQTAAETGDEAMNRRRDEQLSSVLEGVEKECRKLGLIK